MLYLCLTADYELFFGKNLYPENEILIKPAQTLLDTAKKHNARVTLMADVLSVPKYREYGMDGYPSAFEGQLRYAVNEGHDVQLHLHPHWINSRYSDGGWVFDNRNYRLHDLGFDESLRRKNSANKVICDGKKYLENLIRPVKVSYECIAFRAGGWCIQPEKEVLKALKAAGINIDTTVYKNGHMETDPHTFDFRRVPDAADYWIDPDTGINSAAEADRRGNIFEVCIGSYSVTPGLYYFKFLNRLSKAAGKRGNARGLYVGDDKPDNRGLAEKFHKTAEGFIKKPILLSLEGNHTHVLIKIIKHYIKKYRCEANDRYISLITHPKSLHDEDFNRLKEMLDYFNKYYDGIIRYATLTEINDRIFKRAQNSL